LEEYGGTEQVGRVRGDTEKKSLEYAGSSPPDVARGVSFVRLGDVRHGDQGGNKGRTSKGHKGQKQNNQGRQRVMLISASLFLYPTIRRGGTHTGAPPSQKTDMFGGECSPGLFIQVAGALVSGEPT